MSKKLTTMGRLAFVIGSAILIAKIMGVGSPVYAFCSQLEKSAEDTGYGSDCAAAESDLIGKLYADGNLLCNVDPSTCGGGYCNHGPLMVEVSCYWDGSQYAEVGDMDFGCFYCP